MNRPISIALVSLVVVLATICVHHWVNDSEYIRLTFVHWKPGDQDLILNNSESALNEAEMIQLRQLLIRGTLQVEACGEFGYREGASLDSRIVVVIKQPVLATVELLQPDHQNLIYLQGDTGWQKYPNNAPMTKRVIRLGNHEEYPGQTIYWFQRKDGAVNWGTAISW